MTQINSLKPLQQQLERSIVGQKKLLERMLISLLADGHMLLEGAPGLAKTTAVNALATAINAQFHRIQFTPDLMPSDLTGSDIYDPKDGSFQFSSGPIFNHIVLADELNRAPPKVQSALLEAMAEQQVSVGNTTHKLDEFFLVLATQNPLEQQGTFTLPEALLDRFLFKFIIDYPSQDEEVLIIQQARLNKKTDTKETAILSIEEVLELRQQVNKIFIEPTLETYVVKLISATRNIGAHIPEWSSLLKNGASPRASIALLRAAMAKAFLAQRDYVIPEDIIDLAPDVLRHRIMLDFSAQAEGISADDIIKKLIEVIDSP